MEKLTKTDKTEKVHTGILMPILQHRWRFIINSRKFGGEIINAISLQVTNCNVDYKNKTIAVIIEENIEGSIAEEIIKLVDRPSFQCRIDALDGNGNIYFSTEFISSTVDSHNVEFNYAKEGTVKHELSIKFGNMITLFPKND